MALSPNLPGFQAAVVRVRPQIIMAHNIDTLLPAYLAAKKCGAQLIFDSMEFHSDMGEDQLASQVRLIQRIEKLCLPACSLVTTVSQPAVDLLEQEYGLEHVVALHNVPNTEEVTGIAKEDGFCLYWRNSTLGLGQRGLGDCIQALPLLPHEVKLHLQGRPANDGGAAIRELAAQCGVADRVITHAPYQPGNAIREAARFHVGLCMEHAGIRNHEIALSNKVFDYHMAGLAIVASDLPAMGQLIRRSQGGLLYEPGNVASLAKQLLQLYQQPSLHQRLAQNARAYAVEHGNIEVEMRRFQDCLTPLFRQCRIRIST